MAISYGIAQIQGTSGLTNYATLYSPTSGADSIISTLCICNTSTSDKQFRIAISASELSPSADEWIVYDSIVSSNDVTALTLGIVVPDGKYLRISSSDNTVTFNASFSEIS